MKSNEAWLVATEKKVATTAEVREIISTMEGDLAWDVIQAKDIDPRIIDYVANKLHEGMQPSHIARCLGLRGVLSKEWKKIQAHFRQGFRADAEAYLYQQTYKFYKKINQLSDILDDAIENGAPVTMTVSQGKDQPAEIQTVRVKGATKELATFALTYAKALELPVKLWKDFGAIGEKKDLTPPALTILVQNNIPMPSIDEIKKHQEEVIAKSKAIEVKRGK